jgi:MFS family permease
LRETLIGLQFIWRQSTLLIIFAFNGVIGLLVGPLLILPAPFSRTVLHAGAHGYGLLEASFMAGSVVGALTAGMAGKLKHVGWMMIGVVIVGGLLLVGLSYTRILPAAMAFNLSVGIVASVLEVPIMTLIQRRTPDEMRGRVMSTMMMVNTAGMPVSVAAGGILAQIVGVAMLYRQDGLAFVAMGLVCLATPLVRLRADSGDDSKQHDYISRAGPSASDAAPV